MTVVVISDTDCDSDGVSGCDSVRVSDSIGHVASGSESDNALCRQCLG